MISFVYFYIRSIVEKMRLSRQNNRRESWLELFIANIIFQKRRQVQHVPKGAEIVEHNYV